MDAGRKRRQLYSIDGTAARRLEPVVEPRYVPEQTPETERSRRRQQRQEREYRREQRLAPQSAAPTIDLVAMVTLVLALAATFAVCISYLNVQANISTQKKAISKLENLTAELKTKNDYTELKIAESIDLDEIQTVAMTELGMVFPDNNQMIRYKTSDHGYVRQYGELTGNEQESVMEMMLRMLFSYGKNAADSGY